MKIGSQTWFLFYEMLCPEKEFDCKSNIFITVCINITSIAPLIAFAFVGWQKAIEVIILLLSGHIAPIA